MKSNFEKDINIEHEISTYLDKHLYIAPLFTNCTRYNDKDSQNKGIDIILNSKEFNLKSAKADEKCTTYYVNNDINTFAFELLYYKNSESKIGWFLDCEKETEYYVLLWPFAKPEDKYGFIPSLTEKDIVGVRYTIVKRSKIIKYLENQGFTLEKIKSDAEEIIKTDTSGKITIQKNLQFYYFRSPNYAESPINIVIKRNILWLLADKKGGIIGNVLKDNIKAKW